MQAQKETIENLVQDKIDSSKISNSESNSEIKQVQHTNLDSIEIPQTLNKASSIAISQAKKSTAEQIKIPSDPVVVTQVLQVLDRDKYLELEKLVAEKEDVKDAIERTVNKIYKKQSGLAGFVSAAFKGRKIPKDLALELDLLTEYVDELETYIDNMIDAVAFSRELVEKSEINADHKNKLVLRQRAIITLENVIESHQLVKLRKNCSELVSVEEHNLDKL